MSYTHEDLEYVREDDSLIDDEIVQEDIAGLSLPYAEFDLHEDVEWVDDEDDEDDWRDGVAAD